MRCLVIGAAAALLLCSAAGNAAAAPAASSAKTKAVPKAARGIELSPVKLGVVPRWAARTNVGDGWLLAQAPSDEPSKPGKKKTDEPGKGGGVDEPGKGGGADEPTKGGSTKGEPPPSGPPPVKKSEEVSYGIGLQVRAIFVHPWLLHLFLDEATSLNSMAFGGEFIRRKGNFDLIASIDFGFYSPTNGNYLGKGKNPATDTDYIDFRGLNVLAFGVHFIWHHYFTNWLSLVWGAGVGLGIVLGSIWRISNDPARCNADTAGNENVCYPKGQKPNAPETYPVGNGADTPDNPHLYKEDGVWPVVPIVHLLVGLGFKISDQFSIRVDGGFRDAFYIGATGHYFF